MRELLESAVAGLEALHPTVHAAAVFSLFVVGISFAVSATGRLLRRLLSRWSVEDPTAVIVLTRLGQFFIALAGVELILQHFGIDLNTLLAAGGFVAVGIGLAARVFVENMLAGIQLRLDRTIERGDIIIVKGRWLKVRHIGFRATTADSYEDEEVLIPNTELTKSIVSNLTRHGTLYRIRSDVGVAYESDLDVVREALEGCIEGLDFRSDRRPSFVTLDEFGHSSVNYSVRVWIDDADDALRLRSELKEAIWRALRDAGITIAFPQLDVHVKAPDDAPEPAETTDPPAN